MQERKPIIDETTTVNDPLTLCTKIISIKYQMISKENDYFYSANKSMYLESDVPVYYTYIMHTLSIN